jgi:hypothetical protein
MKNMADIADWIQSADIRNLPSFCFCRISGAYGAEQKPFNNDSVGLCFGPRI